MSGKISVVKSHFARLGERGKKGEKSNTGGGRRALYMLICFITFQSLILLRVAANGVGTFAFTAFWLIVLWDIAAAAISWRSGFRTNTIIMYFPPTIFSFGVAVQSAIVITDSDYMSKINDILIQDVMTAMVLFAAAFLLYNPALRIIQMRWVRIAIAAAAVIIYAATIISGRVFGTSDNDANLSLFGVQLHELIKIIFVILMGYILSSETLGTSSKLGLSFLFLTLCCASMVIMNEFGTLLVYVTVYVLSLCTVVDFSNITFSIKTALKKKPVKIVFSVIAAMLLILCVIFYDKVSSAIESKYESRILPWIGLTNNEHKQRMTYAIMNGGIFGIRNIRNVISVPVAQSDVTYTMILQFFGQFGGLVLILLYVLFAYFSQSEAAKSLDLRSRTYAIIASFMFSSQAFIAIASAIGLLPLIGLTTPLISKGGMSYITTFILLAVIIRDHYNFCTGENYEACLTVDDEVSQKISAKTANDREQRVERAISFIKSRAFVRSLLTVVCIVSTAALILTATVAFFIDRKFDLLQTMEFDRSSWIDAPVEEMSGIKLTSKEYVKNILLLGCDKEQDNTQRTDAIMLTSLNTKTNKIKLLSFQRDNYVEIPGRKNKGKLNSAYSYGGAELVIQTIQNNFRIKIDDYIEIDMDGFFAVTEKLDKLTLTITKAEADYINERTKGDLAPGTVDLTPKQALVYVRARKVPGSSGDFGRTERQRKALSAISSELADMAKKGRIGQLNDVINTAAGTVRTSISEDKFNEMLPNILFALNSLGKLEKHGGYDAINSESIPFGKHYDNIRINGSDYIEPQLMENYKYICEYLYK